MSTPKTAVERALSGLLILTDYFCYAILSAMALIVTAEVFSRYVFGFSLKIAEEVASLGLVALIFLSLPATFRDRRFLRIDALYRMLSERAQALLAIAFHIGALVVTSIYVAYLGQLALDSLSRGTRSDMALGTPNYIPQTVMVFGMALLFLVILAGLISALRHARKGREDV